jgi:hypothetical protein
MAETACWMVATKGVDARSGVAAGTGRVGPLGASRFLAGASAQCSRT